MQESLQVQLEKSGDFLCSGGTAYGDLGKQLGGSVQQKQINLSKQQAMARKEKKGGILSNEDVEKELRVRGGDEKSGHSTRGTQDTGDTTVRSLGTEVQRRDGLAPEDLNDRAQTTGKAED